MKLEAIREDRTRGGRSTYQCSYTLPNSMLSPPLSLDGGGNYRSGVGVVVGAGGGAYTNGIPFKMEGSSDGSGSGQHVTLQQSIPSLLQVIWPIFIHFQLANKTSQYKIELFF